MLFNFIFATSLLALLRPVSSATLKSKRDTLVTPVYAYGTNVTGVLFYIDGLAYIGNQSPDFATIASNITLSTDTSDTTVPWTITSNTISSINEASLYIIPTSGSTSQVGFVASNGTAPTNAVTTGFIWFGTQIAYVANDSSIELKFWAVATNTSDLWSLVWNADGAFIDSASPVSLKRTAPPNLSG